MMKVLIEKFQSRKKKLEGADLAVDASIHFSLA